MNDHFRILRLLEKTFNDLDVSLIENIIDEDFYLIQEDQDFSTITSKNDYLDYLKLVFENYKTNNIFLIAKVSVLPDTTPCLFVQVLDNTEIVNQYLIVIRIFNDILISAKTTNHLFKKLPQVDMSFFNDIKNI